MLTRVLCIVAGLGLAGSPAHGQTLPEDVLRSVVSLLPDWPSSGAGRQRRLEPEGSAVAIYPGGYLVTNVHVLGRAETADIRLHDGRLLPVEIVGRDVETDLALIKAPIDLPVLDTSPPPELGGRVCAVGNQFGLGLSVSCGVVSAVHRTGTGFNRIEDFIQTDTAINPGGSGGALLDGKNRLVGIVSAIFTKQSDSNIGVNFAASMRLVGRVTADLRKHGRVVRGTLGFQAGALTKEQRRETGGAVINRIVRGGPAHAAGLQAGDIIVAVGSRKITKPSEVVSAVQMYRSGETVPVHVYSKPGPRTVDVIMAPR